MASNTATSTSTTGNGTGMPGPLLRPLFYPGQALTDRNLTDLVAWVNQRLGLRRLTAGWGVVCGQEVVVDSTIKSPATLLVNPGYSIDPSGADLYNAGSVSAPITLDDQWSTYSQSLSGNVDIGPFKSVPLNQVAVFDVSLAANTTLLSPGIVAGGSCAPACKPTRSQDGVKLALQRINWGQSSQPQSEPAAALAADLVSLFSAVQQNAKDLYSLPAKSGIFPTQAIDSQVTLIRQYLTTIFASQPDLWLRVFPNLPQTTTASASKLDPLATPWGLARVLSWMVDSYQQSACGCHSVPSAIQVPLARVWVRVVTLQSLSVLYIDNHHPHRRGFRPPDEEKDSWKQYIGEKYADLEAATKGRGIALQKETFEFSASTQVLKSQLTLQSQASPSGGTSGGALVAVETPHNAHSDPHAARDPYADRVVGLYSGPVGRQPLATPLTIVIYTPGDDTPDDPLHLLQLSDTSKLTQLSPPGTSLPSDVPVTIAITLDNVPDKATIDVFDDLRLNYTSGIAVPTSGKMTIGGTITLSRQGSSAGIPIPQTPTVTVIIRENGNGRAVAMSQPFPAQVTPYQFNPTLQIKDASGVDFPNLNAPMLVFNNPLPIQLWTQNESPFGFSGTIHVDKTLPAEIETGDEKTLLGSMSASGGKAAMIKLSEPTKDRADHFDPATGTILIPTQNSQQVFWSPNAKDIFGRSKSIFTNTISLNRINVDVAIQKTSDGKNYQLTITNGTAQSLTINTLNVRQFVDNKLGTSLTPDFKSLTIDKGTPKSIPINGGGDDLYSWLVLINFTYGGQTAYVWVDQPATAPAAEPAGIPKAT